MTFLLVYFHFPASALPQSVSFQSPPAVLEPGYILSPNSPSMHRNPITSGAKSSWTNNNAQTVNFSQQAKGFHLKYFSYSCVNRTLGVPFVSFPSKTLVIYFYSYYFPLKFNVTHFSTLSDFTGTNVANNCCSSSESTPKARSVKEKPDQGIHGHSLRGKTLYIMIWHFPICDDWYVIKS